MRTVQRIQAIIGHSVAIRKTSDYVHIAPESWISSRNSARASQKSVQIGTQACDTLSFQLLWLSVEPHSDRLSLLDKSSFLTVVLPEKPARLSLRSGSHNKSAMPR
jgi:hypothetical protein